MSYVALYRKWRPRTFDELKGQDAVSLALKNQVKSGRIGHAYLFCGTRGTGKTSAAKILARAVNCEHPKDGNPCGECPSCRAILKDNSMNVTEIDAASNNGVDNIRDIREQVQYPPSEGRYRVFIIDEVHMLSPGAFNALLKTLEEPPSYCIFILATTELHKVPVTVLSRCQRFDFRRISASVIEERLNELCRAEGIEAEQDALSYIAGRSDGALRDALSLLDECVSFLSGKALTYEAVLEVLGAADVSVFRAMFRAVSEGRTGESLMLLRKVFEEGRDLSQFTSEFLWYLRNLLILKSAERPEGMIDCTREQLDEMRQDAASATKEQLFRYIRLLGDLSGRLRYAAEKRVTAELALIRLGMPEMDDTNDALAERIASLEREVRELRAHGTAPAPAAGASGGLLPVNAPSRQPGAAAPGKAGSGEGQQEQVIALPQAEYDDFMKIRAEWGSLTDALGGMYTAAFKGTKVEPLGKGVLCVVFPNAGTARFGTLEHALERLSALVRERFQKEVQFKTRTAEGGSGSAARYVVTREELKDKIDFPIEFGQE